MTSDDDDDGDDDDDDEGDDDEGDDDDDDNGASNCEGVNTGPLPDDCAKIEDGQIGEDGIVIHLNDITITIIAWIEKDGEPDEYVGFEYEVVGGDVCVAVKSGGDISIEEGTGIWINPNGTFGPDAHGISNIVFCEAEGGDDDDDDDDDDDNNDDNDDDDDDNDDEDTDTSVIVE